MLIDSVVMAFMQSIQSPALVGFSKGISFIFDPVIIILVSLIIALAIYFKKSKKQGVFFGVSILITGVLMKIIKWGFQRVRPIEALVQESGFSFPSGHTTMAMVFFGLIAYLFVSKKHRLEAMFSAIGLTLLIGFTRLYLRVHWLTDVLGGLVLGGIILILSTIIYKKLREPSTPR